MTGETVFGRMKEARFRAAADRIAAVSQERMAELVGEELGRRMQPTQWRRYETDREPPLDVIEATARVSGLSACYIAFGPAAVVPGIAPGDSVRVRRVSRAEFDEAARETDASERAGTAKKRRAGGQRPRRRS